MAFTVKIGNVTLGEDTGYELEFPIVGLAKPDIRMAGSEYSGRDGGFVSAQYYARRQIVLNGFIIGLSCDDFETKKQDFLNELRIRTSLDIFITTFANRNFYTSAYLMDVKMDITSQTAGRFQVSLICEDPFLYDAGDGIDPESGYSLVPIYRSLSGGYETPYELPVEWEPGSEYTIVNNNGDIIIYPQIVLTGTFTNPRIDNLTTGGYVAIDVVTGPGDVLIIDMKERTVTLNGGSILPYRTETSSWWGLVVGQNKIALNTDSPDDTQQGMVRWRNGYESI